ncbi:MAG: sensor histidine kinase [Pseudobdellovibrionaceae bacterium]
MKIDSFINIFNFEKKSQYYIHAGISLLLFFVFLIVSTGIEKRHEDTILGSIQAIFRDDREIQNTAYLSRRLADLESLGTIKCVEAKSVSTGLLYSTSFKDDCVDKPFFLGIMDPVTNGKIRSITGEYFDISFKSGSILTLKVYIIILFVLIVIVANLLVALYSYRIHLKTIALNEEQLASKLLDLKVQEQSAELVKIKIDVAIQESMTQLAKQVAHDIRSPLSALSMVMGTLKDLPEEKRILIRNATQRINDIANDLLQKGKKLENTDQARSNELSNNKSIEAHYCAQPKLDIEFVPTLIDMLVSEKRMQYREYAGLDIQLDLKNSFGVFARVNSNELNRAMSNLINNAIEAFENHQGTVTVGVKRSYIGEEPIVEIFVRDNGKGIPEHLIGNLGMAGVSLGKRESDHSGTGLGIYHAKKTAESFGGSLVIESTVGIGSLFRIILPLAEAPEWFANQIELTNKRFLVSLDDDISVHQIWAGRLQSLGVSEIEHIKFQSSDTFEKYVNSNILHLKETLFLVDFELLNQSKTGLDVIEDLGIEKYSILVTSRYEECNIQERSFRLKLKILPKALAGFVPIALHQG